MTCECARASGGALGPGSGVTLVISLGPRAGATRCVIVNRRDPFELLAEGDAVSRNGVSQEKRQRAGRRRVGLLSALLGSQE